MISTPRLKLFFNKEPKTVFYSQNDFELKIRKLIIGPQENKFLVLDAFNDVYKIPAIKLNKMTVIWEVYYCLYTLKDLRLARIKFTKTNYVSNSFEGEIQELRVKKLLDDYKDMDQIENNFLYYLVDIENVKTKDEELCRVLLELWNEIISKHPRRHILERLMGKSTTLISTINLSYTSLLKMKNPKAFELYGTFLQNILRKPEQSSDIMHKKIMIAKAENTKIYAKITKFDEDNGNIIISGNLDNLGSIIYINEIAAGFLKARISDILDNKVWEYIPSPYNVNHYHHLKNFAATCFSAAIDQLDHLFIQDHQGFIIEIYLLVRLAGIFNNVYFIVSVKPVLSNRQCALVSEDGLIYTYSQSFTEILGYKDTSLRDKRLDKIIPNFYYSKLNYFEPFLLRMENRTVALVRCLVTFKNTDIYYTLLVTDPAEIQN